MLGKEIRSISDEIISEKILSVASKRGPDKSTCPSEIARILFPDDWRNYMTQVVDVAIALCRQGKLRITQHGESIDVNHIRGPIRIKII